MEKKGEEEVKMREKNKILVYYVYVKGLILC